MAGKVLSTPEAEAAYNRMREIIFSGLAEQIDELNRQGQILSDPGVWEGALAQRWRGDWPSVHQGLLRAKETVTEVRQHAEDINRAIQAAGGNA